MAPYFAQRKEMQSTYTTRFIAMHWIHGALLAFVLATALLNLPDLPQAGGDVAPFKGHMILGFLATILIVPRLLFLRAEPALPPLDVPAWRRRLIEWNHRLIYLLIVVVGLSGMATAKSTHLGEVVIFGDDPSVYTGAEGITATLASVHTAGAYLLTALIVMHIAGTIAYALKRRESPLGRMGFRRD
jgi:cytochrome b561